VPGEGTGMEIAQGVYSLGQRKGGRVHAFLFDDGHELTLIDTLFDTDGRRVLDQIARIGRSISDLKNIVLTHGHRSHLGGAAALKRLSGATVYSHEWEADIVAGERKAQAVTLRPMSPYRVYYLQFALAMGLGRHPPCPVDQVLEDESQVGPLQVLHIPGHSPGHLGFYWPERRVLIAGDAIATWPAFDAGWKAFNLNEPQHEQSLQRMAKLDAEVVGVGHGEPITRGGTDKVQELAEQTPR
jgi:glyoxylase-like metal-dependent hydrolase (beta-lactamase superfamily II)